MDGAEGQHGSGYVPTRVRSKIQTLYVYRIYGSTKSDNFDLYPCVYLSV